MIKIFSMIRVIIIIIGAYEHEMLSLCGSVLFEAFLFIHQKLIIFIDLFYLKRLRSVTMNIFRKKIFSF